MHPLIPKALMILSAVAAMVVGGQIDIPMHPVPMTLQSLSVLLAGLVLGPVSGVIAVLVYFLLAVIGLPVLSEGAHGTAPFIGATAGYLYGFILVAALAGLLGQQDKARHPFYGIAGLFGLHLVLLTMGSVWLSTLMGMQAALEAGFTPFLIGALVKSAAAYGIWRYGFRRGETG
jgi:biotin transport system substrate-specific component